MTLTQLKSGESATLLQFNELTSTFQNRLIDVGIAIGSEVTLLNKLNFGQLLHISIDEVEFCIRKKDAENIIVQAG